MSNFDTFYAAYPNKQAKDRCRKYYEKISQQEHQEIMLALEAHKRWRSEMHKAGKFVAEWCNSATWIYQKRYRDEIPISHSELKESIQRQKCAKEGCEETALKTGLCLEHEAKREDWKTQLLRTRFKELGIEKDPDWRTPCLRTIYRMNPFMAKLINRGG